MRQLWHRLSTLWDEPEYNTELTQQVAIPHCSAMPWMLLVKHGRPCTVESHEVREVRHLTPRKCTVVCRVHSDDATDDNSDKEEAQGGAEQ